MTVKTMEDLLKKTGYRLFGLKRGDFIEGRITEIKKRMVLIDVGAKTDGIVVGKDYIEVLDYIQELKPGDTVLAYVKQSENENGQAVLSLRKAAADWRWKFFEEKASTGETVKVKPFQLNKGGMIVQAKGLQGFIPTSQFSKKAQSHLEDLMNKILKVKVIEVDRKNNRLIFSERLVSEAKLIAKKKKLLAKIKIGDVVEGEVVSISPFGVFIKTKKPVVDLDGLVHISEVAWEKVENPEDYFQVGQKIKAKVIGIEKETGRLNLSVKQLKPDPWQKAKDKYQPGKKLKGEVVSLAPFGAFVKFEPGVNGLLHISKIPVDFNINIGDKIDVEIENVDPENRRMSLSLILKKKPVGYR